ncbi:hypothetical protein O181_055190 [Austropuccinia psidii MF-1]|uniref:Uncharacterized protein n=1 Tax=Austropuccinia psidii MF-1 TaxID=1389203 RepID=A0A9Q3E3U9_9BASI|nr:hypothetical protein [Austropuccinia psidii MF-1]
MFTLRRQRCQVFIAHLDYSNHTSAQPTHQLCAPTEQDPFMDSATLPKNSLHLNVAQLCDQKRSLWEDPAMYSLVENQAAVCSKSAQMEEKFGALVTTLALPGLTEAPPSSRHPPLLEEIETSHDNPIKQLPLFVPLGQLESGHVTDHQTSPSLRYQLEAALDPPNSISNTPVTSVSVESHAFQPSNNQVKLLIKDVPEQIQSIASTDLPKSISSQDLNSSHDPVSDLTAQPETKPINGFNPTESNLEKKDSSTPTLSPSPSLFTHLGQPQNPPVSQMSSRVVTP